MVFLHISLASMRMMEPYTKMLRENFPIEEHRILYLDKLGVIDRNLLEYGNSVELAKGEPNRIKKIFHELEMYALSDFLKEDETV